MPQLWHQGVVRHAGTGPYPEAPVMSPSGISKAGGKQIAEPMTQKDIDEVVAGFANSAGYAKGLGFDGVEIHGAHGYLIDQFFWEGTNQRDDAYGGSIEKRTRLGLRNRRGRARGGGTGFPDPAALLAMEAAGLHRAAGADPAELERFWRRW